MSTRNISLNKFLTILFFIAIDAYVYTALRKSIQKSRFKVIWNIIAIILLILGYLGLYLMYLNIIDKPLQTDLKTNLLIGFFFSFFVFKLMLFFFFLAEDIFRLLKLFYHAIVFFFKKEKQAIKTSSRRKFIRQIGLTTAAIPFASMLYGITKGKYNFKVNNLKLAFKNLPKSFDGFKIVQISVIHSGSFDSKEAIINAVDLINQQNADVIMFTGDLVNNDSREIEPYIDVFKQLKAKNGVYSILGNHDYGDYKKWNSEKEKQDNFDLMLEYHKKMNFKLLTNQNTIITKNGEDIGVFGVENWGKPPFPQKGDLDIALSGIEGIPFKILLSHDPTHWTKKVLPHKTHFDLTLSGHTHGMQFGIEIPGFIKWSPIKYIYPQWAGLYEKSKQYLYVNRGFGFLGFPGRAGIMPEITVIELNHIS